MQTFSKFDKLYRFWSPSWIFKDVGRGSSMERMAAWRHNVEHRRDLFPYISRWSALSLSSFGAGALAEIELKWIILAAIFQTLTAVGLVTCVTFMAAFALLHSDKFR